MCASNSPNYSALKPITAMTGISKTDTLTLHSPTSGKFIGGSALWMESNHIFLQYIRFHNLIRCEALTVYFSIIYDQQILVCVVNMPIRVTIQGVVDSGVLASSFFHWVTWAPSLFEVLNDCRLTKWLSEWNALVSGLTWNTRVNHLQMTPSLLSVKCCFKFGTYFTTRL